MPRQSRTHLQQALVCYLPAPAALVQTLLHRAHCRCPGIQIPTLPATVIRHCRCRERCQAKRPSAAQPRRRHGDLWFAAAAGEGRVHRRLQGLLRLPHQHSSPLHLPLRKQQMLVMVLLLLQAATGATARASGHAAASEKGWGCAWGRVLTRAQETARSEAQAPLRTREVSPPAGPAPWKPRPRHQLPVQCQQQ